MTVRQRIQAETASHIARRESEAKANGKVKGRVLTAREARDLNHADLTKRAAKVMTKPVAKKQPAKKVASPTSPMTERAESRKVKAAKATMKIPKAIGAVADLYYTTRQDRLEANKGVETMKADETVLKNYLIDNLPKSSATGAAGKIARAQIYTVSEPCVTDWEEFYKYLKKTGQFDLLNRALNATAVRERWDAGKTIPGVGSFDVVKISLSKL